MSHSWANSGTFIRRRIWVTENTWGSTSPEICASGGLIILSFIKVAQQHELVLIMSEQPHPDKLSICTASIQTLPANCWENVPMNCPSAVSEVMGELKFKLVKNFMKNYPHYSNESNRKGTQDVVQNRFSVTAKERTWRAAIEILNSVARWSR